MIYRRKFILFFIFLILSIPVSAQETDDGIRPGYMLAGDMIIPETWTRFGYDGAVRLWPGGIVPYVFDSGVLQINRERTLAAMKDWESASGVRFVPRTTEPNYIRFINGTAINSSYVGMIGGMQDVKIAAWASRSTLLHELGHALGLWHEQQRPDRDNYVTIHYENIPPQYYYAFNIIPSVKTLRPYDFLSIMHYSDDAFSTNGQPTIQALPAYTQHQDRMGLYEMLSQKDRAGMQDLYPGTPRVWGDNRNFPILVSRYDPSFSVVFSTSSATKAKNDPVPSCLGTNSFGHTVWLVIDSFYSGYNRFETLTINAGGYDTLVSVYRSTVGGLQEKGCVNAVSGTGMETLNTTMASGERYYVMVAGVNDSAGKLRVEAAVTDDLPANTPLPDDFDSAVEMSGIRFVSATDTTNATEATDDPAIPCGSTRLATFWYRWTAPTNTRVRIQTSSNAYLATTTVWTGTRGNLTSVACGQTYWTPLEFDASAGVTYYVMLSTHNTINRGTVIVSADFISDNLLVNGDMEDADANRVPDGWKVGNATGDRTICDPVENKTGTNGFCAFRFTAKASSTARLFQTVNRSGLAGDAYRFSMWMKNTNSAAKYPLKVDLQFIKNGTITRRTITLRPLDVRGFYHYDRPVIKAPVDYDRIKVSLVFNQAQGELLIDDIRLSPTVNFNPVGFPPLPPAQ